MNEDEQHRQNVARHDMQRRVALKQIAGELKHQKDFLGWQDWKGGVDDSEFLASRLMNVIDLVIRLAEEEASR